MAEDLSFITYSLTEQEKDLLKCAFKFAIIDCNSCSNKGFCNEVTFNEMGQDLLVRMGIIPHRVLKKMTFEEAVDKIIITKNVLGRENEGSEHA